jgi:hypothetical protein
MRRAGVACVQHPVLSLSCSMAEVAAATATAPAEPQHGDQQQPAAAADGGGGSRRCLWLLLVVPAGIMLVVSPLLLQDLDQKLVPDERGAADCVKVSLQKKSRED